jgi:hypothetical protein
MRGTATPSGPRMPRMVEKWIWSAGGIIIDKGKTEGVWRAMSAVVGFCHVTSSGKLWHQVWSLGLEIQRAKDSRGVWKYRNSARHVPSWEANISSASQYIRSDLLTPQVHCRVHNSASPVPFLSQINPVAASYHTSCTSTLILSFHLCVGILSGIFLL